MPLPGPGAWGAGVGRVLEMAILPLPCAFCWGVGRAVSQSGGKVSVLRNTSPMAGISEEEVKVVSNSESKGITRAERCHSEKSHHHGNTRWHSMIQTQATSRRLDRIRIRSPPALTLLPSSPSNRRTIWTGSTLWPLPRKLILVRKEP